MENGETVWTPKVLSRYNKPNSKSCPMTTYTENWTKYFQNLFWMSLAVISFLFHHLTFFQVMFRSVISARILVIATLEVSQTKMFFKYGPNPASFCLISSFSQYNDKHSTKFDYKSIDGVLGIQTRDCRMVGTDESTELWRPPPKYVVYPHSTSDWRISFFLIQISSIWNTLNSDMKNLFITSPLLAKNSLFWSWPLVNLLVMIFLCDIPR